MLDSLFSYFANRGLGQLGRDALDVAIVYYVVYRALLVLRGTRAMQVGVGLGLVFLVYLVAKLFHLVTVLSLLSALISSILLIIVVVFQNDIRRGLMRVGSSAWFGRWTRAQESAVIDEVVVAATELARHRTGAIIAFEQEANLDEFVGVNKGTTLDAAVSRELLVTLFQPIEENPLHDGAVVIRNFRIAKAGVFFPMPDVRVVDQSFGSRHRAALGITEETDAVVVVVSEERGTISFCFNGNIASNLDGPKLRTMLEAVFAPKARKKPESARPAAASEPTGEAVTVAVVEAPNHLTPLRISMIPDEIPPTQRPPRVAGDSEPPPPLRARVSAEGESKPAPLRASARVESSGPRDSVHEDDATATLDEPPTSPRGSGP